MTKKVTAKRSPVVFPKNRKILEQLGENIKLACKRRAYTQTLISERTGLSRLTIRKIELCEVEILEDLRGISGERLHIGNQVGLYARLPPASTDPTSKY